jgi:hypothetical protein
MLSARLCRAAFVRTSPDIFYSVPLWSDTPIPGLYPKKSRSRPCGQFSPHYSHARSINCLACVLAWITHSSQFLACEQRSPRRIFSVHS